MEIAIDEQIAELGRMTVTQLRQKYAEVFGEEILTNALYSGMVDHKGVLYPGEHERIVDQRVWDKVQTMLRQNGRGNGSYAKNKYGALLRGVLFCAHYDTAMMHTYTAKGPRRYRYYVCYKAQQKGWQNCRTKSVAAEAIERAVLNSIRRLSSDPPLVGSFERWTEVIAGILQHAQVDGFLANSERLFEQSDVERSDWETFIEVVEDSFPGVPFSIAEFWERLNEKSYEELIGQSVLTDRAEELRNALPADLTRWMDREGPFKQRLGVAFNQRRGRRFGKRQLRIKRAAGDTHGKVERWKVEADVMHIALSPRRSPQIPLTIRAKRN